MISHKDPLNNTVKHTCNLFRNRITRKLRKAKKHITKNILKIILITRRSRGKELITTNKSNWNPKYYLKTQIPHSFLLYY